FSRRSIQWDYYSNPNHIYIAIEKLSNLNIIKNIELSKEPLININEDVEHIDYKLYNIGEKIYSISMNSDILRSFFPLSENGKEIVYNYINILPSSYENTENNSINQNIEMELDQKTNQELSKKYGFSVDPSLLLQQYQHHPNPEIAFIGRELYRYIKETIQYRIRFHLDALVKMQLFEVNTQDIYKFKNENLTDNNSNPNFSKNNKNKNFSNMENSSFGNTQYKYENGYEYEDENENENDDDDENGNLNLNLNKHKSKRKKRHFDEIDDTSFDFNSSSSILGMYDDDDDDDNDDEEMNEMNDFRNINSGFNFNYNRKLKNKYNNADTNTNHTINSNNHTIYVLVLEWNYPPETFQKIPLWNNRLKRKAYFCQDWTKNQSATNASRHYIFGTRECLAKIYYSILKRVPRLFKPLESNNLIFEPHIIKHRIFPKPYLKNYISSTRSSLSLSSSSSSSSSSSTSETLSSSTLHPLSLSVSSSNEGMKGPSPIFNKQFLQNQTIQNLRQLIFDYDLFDEINMDSDKESIIRDLLLYDVIYHPEDNKENNSIVSSQQFLIMNNDNGINSNNNSHQNKINSYYYVFHTMDDQTIHSIFTIPLPTLKVLQDHGFDFELHMPYGYFKVKLEKYPLCFQNFLWNHIHQPEQLNEYLNDVVPVEVQWNYQIPEFLISIVNDEGEGREIQYRSTLKVSHFILHNTNPEIYWCFCERRMLTTDYYHHCEKCGVCYDINYWHCDACQKCSIGINIGVCNYCGKARESFY
ncbi:hypothetical protein U3516DRAFT_770274, partial [Neocallimastix sp. 'constans']